MKKKRTLAEYRQVAGIDSNKHHKKGMNPVPKYDPFTGELNPHYKELTGEDNPMEVYEEVFKNCDVPQALKKIDESSWEEMECDNVQKFRYGEFPELIYVIKTGFKNKYIVVQEDAYELHLGNSKLMTKKSVEKTYGIKLSV